MTPAAWAAMGAAEQAAYWQQWQQWSAYYAAQSPAGGAVDPSAAQQYGSMGQYGGVAAEQGGFGQQYGQTGPAVRFRSRNGNELLVVSRLSFNVCASVGGGW